MNKQELIDKVVNCLKGKDIPLGGVEVDGRRFSTYMGYLFEWTQDEPVQLCRHSHLDKRAKELGWINGYKWGKEYPTNGKKPDLPDGIKIVCRLRNSIHSCSYFSGQDVRWCDYDKFRIVDERYKPVDVVSKIPEKQQNVSVLSENNQKTENVSDWYDYEKQQAIALPPVGVECEMVHSGISSYGWQKVTIENYFQSLDKKNRVVVSNHNGNVWSVKHPVIKVDDELVFRPIDWNRKADEEKRKFVESGVEAVGDYFSLGDALRRLYDAGCRFTKSKAAS